MTDLEGLMKREDPRWAQSAIALHQAGYHDLGEFIDQAAEALDTLKGERDEAQARIAFDFHADPPPHWKAGPSRYEHPTEPEQWDYRNDPTGEALDASIRRLNFARDYADPRAPDQMAVVLRLDLIRALGELTWRTAQSQSRLEGRERAEARAAELERLLEEVVGAGEEVVRWFERWAGKTANQEAALRDLSKALAKAKSAAGQSAKGLPVDGSSPHTNLIDPIAKELHARSCAERGVEPKWSGCRTNRAYYRRLARATEAGRQALQGSQADGR